MLSFEYEKLGSRLADDLKVAILLRCISGQLKTWLQLQVTEGTTYAKVREMVLMFDSSTIRWSDSMALGAENVPGTSEAVPMEIDRVQQKGKGKVEKGSPARVLPRVNPRESQREKIPKENQRAMTARVPRDMLVVDQREKEKGGSATIVARPGIWPKTVGSR